LIINELNEFLIRCVCPEVEIGNIECIVGIIYRNRNDMLENEMAKKTRKCTFGLILFVS